MDFRSWGLVFDHGWGKVPIKLDAPNAAGKDGLIAFHRGRSEYLSGALCETEPPVQNFWLSCITEMLDAGVDGIDIRGKNHSTHTEYSGDYGFNDVVIEQCQRRGDASDDTVAQVRREACTDFLRRAKQLISARGKRLRYNLNVEYFGGDAPTNRLLAFPANLHFDWKR